MRGLGHGTQSGAPPVRQPIRNEDVIPNAQLRLAAACEQQRRQTEKVKAQTYPLPKTQPILDRVQLNHQKLSKKTDLQRKEDKKISEVLAELILPPVCQEFSSGVHFCKHYNVKRKEREKKIKSTVFLNLRHVSVPASVSSGLQEPPSIPCNTVQWYVTMENTVLLTFVNIFFRVAVLRVCNLKRAIALRFTVEMNKTL